MTTPGAAPRALPALLSFNGGYVDTAGFLALQGLFTAHVTGNFVTFGASLVQGSSGAVAKLLALPVFCLVVVLAKLASDLMTGRGWPALRLLLLAKVLLLALGAGLAVRLGPFHSGDSAAALGTGLTLVAAMAIQNAVHRLHLGSAPPTTLMTGTTTQIMIDLTDCWRHGDPAARAAAQGRLLRMLASVAAFAVGCAAAALLFAATGPWCFVVAPLVGGLAMILR